MKLIDNKEKDRWMLAALNEARKAGRKDEVPIGVVIVKDNAIVGRGFNQVESLCDATAHAEIIAITSASNTLGDWRLNKCQLFVTKEPCIMCLGALMNSRIEQLYYGISDKETGSINMSCFQHNFKHLKYIEGNILKYECKKIIQDFFLKKR